MGYFPRNDKDQLKHQSIKLLRLGTLVNQSERAANNKFFLCNVPKIRKYYLVIARTGSGQIDEVWSIV